MGQTIFFRSPCLINLIESQLEFLKVETKSEHLIIKNLNCFNQTKLSSTRKWIIFKMKAMQKFHMMKRLITNIIY